MPEFYGILSKMEVSYVMGGSPKSSKSWTTIATHGGLGIPNDLRTPKGCLLVQSSLAERVAELQHGALVHGGGRNWCLGLGRDDPLWMFARTDPHPQIYMMRLRYTSFNLEVFCVQRSSNISVMEKELCYICIQPWILTRMICDLPSKCCTCLYNVEPPR